MYPPFAKEIYGRLSFLHIESFQSMMGKTNIYCLADLYVVPSFLQNVTDITGTTIS